MTPPLLTFFAATFTLSWSVFIGVAWLAQSLSIPIAVTAQLVLPGVFAPAVVALWLTRREQGKAGTDALLARLFRWDVGARWYVFAVGYFAVVKLGVALAHRAAVGEWPETALSALPLMLAGILVSTPIQAGEEIGWRGYALPRLSARMGLPLASLLLGVLWALWHLPFFFIAAADTYGQSLILYVVQVTAISVALAWLYTRTGGSLLLVMLMHASFNNLKGLVPSTPRPPANILSPDASLLSWLGVLLLWIPALYLTIRMRGVTPERGARPSDTAPPPAGAGNQ